MYYTDGHWSRELKNSCARATDGGELHGELPDQGQTQLGLKDTASSIFATVCP